MQRKRPLGVTLIGCFYIFGAVVLILTLGIKQGIQINIRFGVPSLPETIVRLFVVALSFIMTYGYLKLEKWGYWLMIFYSVAFLIISLNQLSVYNSQPFLGNAIFSLLVIVYTYTKRRYFGEKLVEINTI